MTSQKSRKNAAMPPGGKRTKRAELEERLRIVERCLAEGRSSADEIRAEIETEKDVDVPLRTVYDYIKTVRKRRTAEDEDIRLIRRAALMAEAGKTSRIVLGLLIRHNVKPKWSDLIKLMEFKAEHGGIADVGPLVTHEEDRDDLDDLPEERLDELLDEMLSKVQAPEEAPRPATEREA